MKVGLSSYTYAWAAGIPGTPAPQTPFTPERLIDLASELGADAVQIADNMPLHNLTAGRLSEVAARARQSGVAIEVGTRGTALGDLERYLRVAETCASRILRSVPSVELQPGDHAGEEKFLDDTQHEISSLVPDLERMDVTLCLENYEGISVRTLARLVGRIDSPHVRVCLDSLNSLGRSEGYETVASELAALTANLHIKDYRISRMDHRLGFVVEGTPAGSGVLPVQDLVARVGPQATAVVELWTPWQGTIEKTCDTEAAWARESVAFLRGEASQNPWSSE
mgnify:FL=1